MKTRLFLVLLPLLAACGAEPPTLHLDGSVIPLTCLTDRFATKGAQLSSLANKNNYTFSRTEASDSWAPVRCGTKFPAYVSTNYTETRVPINVTGWAGLSTPKTASALRGDSIIGPDGVLYTYFIEWKW